MMNNVTSDFETRRKRFNTSNQSGGLYLRFGTLKEDEIQNIHVI